MMNLVAVLGLAVAQPADTRTDLPVPVQCPNIDLIANSDHKAKLISSELLSRNGPLIQLSLAATTDEVQRFGRLGFIRIDGKPFAGGLLGRQLDDRGETHFVLSFNDDMLPTLTRGVSLELIAKDGPGLKIALAAADPAPMINCFAGNPLYADPAATPDAGWRSVFLPTEPNQTLLIRWRRNLDHSYPASALHERREGETRVRFVIGTDGRIAKCDVTVSSGHADLDAAACNAARRVIYVPTTNAAAEPTETEREQRVIWKIPE